jgi:hypothetical protein
MLSPLGTLPTRARLRDCFHHQTKMVGRLSSVPPTTAGSPCPLSSSATLVSSSIPLLIINTSALSSQSIPPIAVHIKASRQFSSPHPQPSSPCIWKWPHYLNISVHSCLLQDSSRVKMLLLVKPVPKSCTDCVKAQSCSLSSSRLLAVSFCALPTETALPFPLQPQCFICALSLAILLWCAVPPMCVL